MEALIPQSYRVLVSEPSQIGEARRYATDMAGELGFTSTQQGRVGIVATELASNLVKFAQGGEFIAQEVRAGGLRGLDLVALDTGPGFSDAARIMRDGYSTTGTPGTGLGAVMRLSSEFDLFSTPKLGSVFVSRIWAHDAPRRQSSKLDPGVVSVPHPGEKISGDSWWLEERGSGQYAVLMVDGLGHGGFAAEAAAAAVESFRQNGSQAPEAVIERMHGALRATRGAALAVALVDTAKGRVDYAGVGNITGAVISDSGIRRMVSHDGTVGHTVHRVQKFTYPWPHGALLVMHSDGLTANWNLDPYPGLLARHPSVIAAVWYRAYRRKNDDATVLVAREVEPEISN